MKLRPYQQQAKDAIIGEWNSGVKKTLLVLPTGTGKTIVFSKVIEDRVERGQRVLVLAHRAELLDQAADKLQKSTGLMAATEKADKTSVGSMFSVVVGSVQTMMRDSRLARFSPDYFGSIIVDEAHHCISDSYQKVLKHFSGANVLGVTATPDRGDMRNLGSYFESLAYEYTMPTAIKEGYLSPIMAQTIPLEIDLSGVHQQAGDFNANDLGDALDPYLPLIADEMARRCQGRKAVVFLPLIRTSRRFCDLLIERGIDAAEVNGDSPDRAEILADFDGGRYDVLCNSMLLTEGWDCPSVDCIVVLRPTKIRSLYCQMIGRGTRLHPGKDNLLILDFLWHTDRHELCRPAHLICKTDEIADKVTDMIANSDEPWNIAAAEEQAERDAQEEREKSLAKMLKAMRGLKGKLVDPLQYEMSIMDEDLASYRPTFAWEMAPATDKQVKTLENFGISTAMIENAGKASKLLDRLFKRRAEGLATPKQIRCLEQKGFQHVGTWRFDDAKAMIDQIAGNGWKVPYRIKPHDYKPSARGA